MMEFRPKGKWKKFEHPLGGHWWKWGYLTVCVAQEDGLWHLSISQPYRYPHWEEIKQAWYDLVPGAGEEFEGAIILPRKSDYINLHQNCFHVYQLKEEEWSRIQLPAATPQASSR